MEKDAPPSYDVHDQPQQPQVQYYGQPQPGAYPQQTYGQPGQVIVVQQQGPAALPARTPRVHAIKGVGICVVVASILAVIFNIVTIAAWGGPLNGVGFWGAIMPLVAGIIGIAIGATGKTQLTIPCLVIAIIGAIDAFIAMCVAANAVTVISVYFNYILNAGILYIFAILLCIICLINFILAIILASFCCSCCYAPSTNQVA